MYLGGAPITAPLVRAERELDRVRVDARDGLRPLSVRHAQPRLSGENLFFDRKRELN